MLKIYNCVQSEILTALLTQTQVFWMWHYVGWVLPDVWKECSAFTFKGQAAKFLEDIKNHSTKDTVSYPRRQILSK